MNEYLDSLIQMIRTLHKMGHELRDDGYHELSELTNTAEDAVGDVVQELVDYYGAVDS